MSIFSNLTAAGGIPGLGALGSLPDLGKLLSDFASPFGQNARLLTLEIGDDDAFGQILLPLSAHGEEELSGPWRYEVVCVSPDVRLELKKLLSRRAQIGILAADGRVPRQGVITRAQALPSDGGFALYGLTIEPAFAMLAHRRASRVFQDMSVPDIIKQILDEHRKGNSVFAANFDYRFELLGNYAPRSYTLQYRESDLDFALRILGEEGITYRVEFEPSGEEDEDEGEGEDGGGGASQRRKSIGAKKEPYRATQVFTDTPTSLPRAGQGSVRFHRADATEKKDSLTQWTGERSLGSGSTSLASFDYKPVFTEQNTQATEIDQGEQGEAAESTLEDFDPQTLYYSPEGLDRYGQLRQQAIDRLKKQFFGEGTIRQLLAGTWFTLEKHPAHERDGAETREFIVTRLEFDARNNLPGGTPEKEPPYQVKFTAQRRDIPLTPAFAHTAHAKPTAPGIQTATVTGPPAADGKPPEEVFTDEMGRIRIQFHWQRKSEHPKFGADMDEKSSCWVRVAYPSAGDGWGHQSIPRVGQEVVVEFIEGDIDRPVVTGVVYNGRHWTPQFSGAGSLPANKTLSGQKSKEHHGTQYGELLFDDTTGQVRTKLSSEHGKTQLNQGFLIHPRKNGEGKPRGDGFELRTDRHGAVRAKEGLLLTTEPQPGANGGQLDRDAAQAQIKAAQQAAQKLADVAEHQNADIVETGPETRSEEGDKQGKAAEGHIDHLVKTTAAWEAETNTDPEAKTVADGQPGRQGVLLAYGAKGIGITTPNELLLSSGSNLDTVSLRDTQQTTARRWLHNAGKKISLFVLGVKDKINLKLIAANGHAQLHAQSGDVEVAGEQNLRLYAVKKQIVVEGGEEILLNSGGAYIRLKGGNIELHCPGNISIKSAGQSLSGPASMSLPMPRMPQPGQVRQQLELNYRYAHNMEPVVGAPYWVKFADGTEIRGKLDDKGHALLENTPDCKTTEIGYGWDARDPVPWEPPREANPFFGQGSTDPATAEKNIEAYLAASAEELDDNYFPDEIEDMFATDTEYEFHYDDYQLPGEEVEAQEYASTHLGDDHGEGGGEAPQDAKEEGKAGGSAPGSSEETGEKA